MTAYSSTNQFVYRPNVKPVWPTNFDNKLYWVENMFVFKLKMCLCLNKMFPKQNVSKTQNILLKQGNKSRIIAYPDWKSYLRKCARGG